MGKLPQKASDRTQPIGDTAAMASRGAVLKPPRPQVQVSLETVGQTHTPAEQAKNPAVNAAPPSIAVTTAQPGMTAADAKAPTPGEEAKE
jgi:hypothetical protein